MASEHKAAPAVLPDDEAQRMSYAEIGTLAQVRRPVVTTWARRYADFPVPVAYEGNRPLFDGHAILEWLLATGRGNAQPAQLRAELALHTLVAWRGKMPADVLVNALTALLCLRSQSSGGFAGRTWPQILSEAAYLDPADTFLLAELDAVPGSEHVGVRLAALAEELTEAAYSPAEAFQWVLESRSRLGAGDQPPAPAGKVLQVLARLTGIDLVTEGAPVIAVAHAADGALLDALRGVAACDCDPLYLAAEADSASIRHIHRRMLVHGVPEYRYDVTDTDDLTAAGLWEDPDIVVCPLPYVPAEARSPLTTLGQVLSLTDLLRDHRVAVVLGPADVLVRPLDPQHDADGDRLRRSFLAEGLLKAVISLPEGVYPSRPGHRTAIWVLSRTPRPERRGVLLLADLSSRPLTGQVLDALVEDVQIFRDRGWQEDPHHASRNAVIVPAKILYDLPGTAFTPQHRPLASRFTREVVERPAQISDLELVLKQLTEQARRRTAEEDEIRAHAILRSEGDRVPRTSIRRLLRRRQGQPARLRRLPGHRLAPAHIGAEGRYPVLTPAEVIGTEPVGARRIDRDVLLTHYGHAEFSEPGDVIVTAQPSFGAYVDEEGLSVVAYPARILRVRLSADRPLRPRVLAALLRAAAAEHTRVPGAIRAARGIEDLLIPDLPPDEAERYDALLAQISHRKSLLRQQDIVLDDLARLMAIGLTDGTLKLDVPDR